MAAVLERFAGSYVSGRTASATPVRSQAVQALALPAYVGGEAGHYGLVASLGAEPYELRRHGTARPSLREDLLVDHRSQDPARDARGGDLREGRLLTVPAECRQTMANTNTMRTLALPPRRRGWRNAKVVSRWTTTSV